MPCEQVKTVNFGSTKSGLSGSVGYTIMNTKGTVVTPRTTEGVYETLPGSGIYAKLICFPDDFRGTIAWDTGEVKPAYAAEEYNFTENTNKLMWRLEDAITQIKFIRGMTAGRWCLDEENATMSFYSDEDDSLLVTYKLFDESNKPSIERVFERIVDNHRMPANVVALSLPAPDPDPTP